MRILLFILFILLIVFAAVDYFTPIINIKLAKTIVNLLKDNPLYGFIAILLFILFRIKAIKELFFRKKKPSKKKIFKLIKSYLKSLEEDIKHRREKRGFSDLFIEPALREKIEELKEDFHITEKKELFEYKSIDIKDLIKNPRGGKEGYVVVADSGMGKTSLLEQLCLLIAENEIETDLIPIFFEFINLKNIKNSYELKNLIKDKISIYNDDLIDKWFNDNHFVIFIDSLDQVVGIDDAHFFKNIFETNIFGKNHMIFSTRPFAYSKFKYSSNNSDDYQTIEIELFDNKRIKTYLGDKHEDVKKQLHHSMELLKVPILISHVKSLVESGELAGIKNKTDLYQKITNKLFITEKIRKLLGENNTFYRPQNLIRLLSIISFYTLSKGFIYRFKRDFEYQELENIDIKRNEVELLLNVGIISEIIEGDKEEIIYRHQSFQEYFASLKLKKELFKNGKLNEKLSRNCLEYRYWDEVIIFTVGGLDIEKAKKVIEYIENYDYNLSALCLSTYKGERKEFNRFIDKLFKNFNHDSVLILSKISDENIYKKILNLLKNKDENYFVREKAAAALGEIGSDEAIEPLVYALLNDEEELVRMYAADALGKIGSDGAIEPLVNALNDKEINVKLNAAESLAELGSDKAIQPLISVLKDGRTDFNRRATKALVKIGSNLVIQNLINALNDEDINVRWYAAHSLGEIGSDEAIEPLVNALNDDDWSIRLKVAEALGKIGTDDAIKPLINALNDEDNNVRRCADEALVEIGSDKAIKFLINALDNENKKAKWEAAIALGKMKSDETIILLIDAIRYSYNDNIIQRAAEALGEIGSDEAIEHLINALNDKQKTVRRLAAYALGKTRSDEAIEPLIKALNDKEWEVQWEAAKALGKIGSDKGIQYIINALIYEESEIRMIAAESLGEIGTEKVVQPLVYVLNDEEALVRSYAARALGEIGSDVVVQPLINALSDEEFDVEWHASEALVKIVNNFKKIKQDEIVKEIFIKSKKDKKNSKKYFDCIKEITEATGRRFIDILYNDKK